MSTNAATDSQNSQENTDTSSNQNEGANNTPDTSTGSNQNEGKISFTPEQQSFINSLVKGESEKATAKAQKNWEADAKLSEDEKLKKELSETRAALQERDTRDFVKEKAGKAGVNNPNLFFEANKSKFERNDKGEITNFDDVLKSSKTEFPELFITAAAGNGSADAGSGNQQTSSNSLDNQIRQALGFS